MKRDMEKEERIVEKGKLGQGGVSENACKNIKQENVRGERGEKGEINLFISLRGVRKII